MRKIRKKIKSTYFVFKWVNEICLMTNCELERIAKIESVLFDDLNFHSYAHTYTRIRKWIDSIKKSQVQLFDFVHRLHINTYWHVYDALRCKFSCQLIKTFCFTQFSGNKASIRKRIYVTKEISQCLVR